jgi:hypothetical protein
MKIVHAERVEVYGAQGADALRSCIDHQVLSKPIEELERADNFR